LDNQKLQSLLDREDGTKLDFKRELNIENGSGKKELAKDVSAIANSRGGRGYIVFGIEDKTKRVLGINPADFAEEKIQQVISTRCDPPIPISLDIVEYNGKQIAVITIYSGEQKPYQMRESGAFYIRRGSTTDLMRKEELASLLQDTGLLNYELTPVQKAGLDSLDIDKVREYTSKIGVNFNGDNFDIIESLGIIVKDRESSEYHPTAGGLMLFGSKPQVYLPHTSIRVVNYINPDFKGIEVFFGSVLQMIDSAEEYIKNIINNVSYPVGTINEALENALVHRDYFDIYHETSVVLSPKSIEVISPGSLIGGTEVNTHGVNVPARRNMWLYQRLMTLDTKNRFTQTGTGFSRMRKAFKGAGRVKIVSIDDRNLFKVIFPGPDVFK
jgi:predicted HTH transcriptional regulator